MSCTTPALRIRKGGIDHRSAFTLIELLVVMGIIVLMMALLVPAFNAIGGQQDFNTAATSISTTLEQARAYAMANNTYVFVGIGEFDAKVSDNAPQTAASGNTGGRVALAIVASRSGARGYDNSVNQAGSSWQTNYNNGTNLVAIGKLLRFENVHMATSFLPSTGGMSRPPTTSTGNPLNYLLGATASQSVTPFSYPLGSNGGNYNFVWVINFDPQGVARIQTNASTDTIGAPYLEADLQQIHGNATLTSTAGHIAAIQLNSVSGATRIYRP